MIEELGLLVAATSLWPGSSPLCYAYQYLQPLAACALTNDYTPTTHMLQDDKDPVFAAHTDRLKDALNEENANVIDGIVDSLNNFAGKAELKSAQKVFATPLPQRR